MDKKGDFLDMKDDFTNDIIVSSLETLKIRNGWNDHLISKFSELNNSNNLIDLTILSKAFEEATNLEGVDDFD